MVDESVGVEPPPESTKISLSNGSASIWGFAIYLAGRDGYEDDILPSGLPAAAPKNPSAATL